MNGKSTLPGELSHPSTRSVVHWECWPHWVSSHADIKGLLHTTRLFHLRMAVHHQHKLLLHQPQRYFRKLSGRVQQCRHRGPSYQRRAAELLDRWPQCPLYSRLSMRSPKQAGLLGGLPTLSLPGSQVLAPLFFFSSPFASVLLMFPPPTPLLPIMGTP